MPFTQNVKPTFPLQPIVSRVQIANADAQAQKTGYTAGANGSKIVGVIAASDDTSNRDIQISLTNGGTSYPLATKTVPLASGTSAAAAPVNLLDPSVIPGLPLDSDGNPFLYLISGDTLTFEALVTVTSGKHVTIHVIGADF
jgi:hypothetical protein